VRRTGAWLLLTAVALLLGAASFLALSAIDESGGCDDFAFTERQWNGTVDERRTTAESLATCTYLQGMSRAQVVSTLGPNYDRDSEGGITYYAGLVNDALGPGDSQRLRITFVDGRAEQVLLLTP
jgi:hypothetical protein